MMNTFTAQITVLACLFFGNIIFGSLPSLLNKLTGHFSNSEDSWSRRIKSVTFMLYFGAGTFISNSFLVLLPQANKEFMNADHHAHDHIENSTQTSSENDAGHHHHHSFPMPEFTVLCGFFLAYLMQETIFFLLTKLSKTPREGNDLRVRFCSCAKRHTECSRTFKDARPDQTLYGLEKKLMESGGIPKSSDAATNAPPEADVTAKSELLRSSIFAQAVPNYGAVTNVAEPAIENPLPVLPSPVLLGDERRIVFEHQDETRYEIKILINSMLIVIALALQYIFLGVHLGLRTQPFKRWSYLTVVCLQNFVLTFSLGSYLAFGNVEFLYTVIFIVVLSTVSPIGLITVMIENDALENISGLTKGIVLAVACGILLYTTFNEIVRQKSLVMAGLTKFFAIIMGASIMILLQYAPSIL